MRRHSIVNHPRHVVNKWYVHKTFTGWKKSQSAVVRRRKLLLSTDRRKSLYRRYLESARRIQALSNVTADVITKRLARSDALFFYDKARKLKSSMMKKFGGEKK